MGGWRKQACLASYPKSKAYRDKPPVGGPPSWDHRLGGSLRAGPSALGSLQEQVTSAGRAAQPAWYMILPVLKLARFLQKFTHSTHITEYLLGAWHCARTLGAQDDTVLP